MGRTPARVAAALAGLLLILCAALPAGAQSWRVEAAAGAVHSFRLPLRIEQRGAPVIETDAHWATRALDVPIYWVIRLERLRGGSAWGVELMHHKLFLEDAPAGVDRFEITHGFNILSLVRSAGAGRLRHRLGIGAVVAHPENTVRGRELTRADGFFARYEITGPALQAALAGVQRLGGGFSALLELKALGARARVPVADGRATFWNAALHLNAGVSRSF